MGSRLRTMESPHSAGRHPWKVKAPELLVVRFHDDSCPTELGQSPGIPIIQATFLAMGQDELGEHATTELAYYVHRFNSL